MVHKEKMSLWKMKRLLRRLCGDEPWIPCETFETDNDLLLFGDDSERTRSGNIGLLRGKEVHDIPRENAIRLDQEEVPLEKIEATKQAQTDKSDSRPDDVTMMDAASTTGSEEIPVKNVEAFVKNQNKDLTVELSAAGDRTFAVSKPDSDDQNQGIEQEDTEMAAKVRQTNGDLPMIEQDVDADIAEDQVEEEAEPAVPRRMRTRAQAHAASDDTPVSQTRSSTPESNSDFYIHPYFLAPSTSHPDRDFGLPMAEAADARRILQLYIQKQEEVCRGAQKLYDGLLRADRMRKDVMKWAKAEAHIGEMSDGEDWYDRDEWNLDEDLVKGHDDEEEETTTTNKKTTRARRV